MTEEQIQSARLRAQQQAELMGTDYVDPFPETGPTPAAAAPLPADAPTAELSDEEIIEALNKRGIKTTSLADMLPKPTDDEIAIAKADKQNKMLAYGLSTGKFKKEEYDTFLQVDKMQLVRSDIAKKIKAANPDLSEDAVDEKVASYVFAHLDPSDPIRKQREEELIELADARLRKQYANIYNLESDFEQYEQGVSNKATFERKVQAALPVLKNDVKTALSELASFDVIIPDIKRPENNVTVKAKFSETDLKEVEDAFLDHKSVYALVKDGYSVETIRDTVRQVLVSKHLNRLISQAARDYSSIQKDKYIRGLKGLLPAGAMLDIADDNSSSTKDDVYGQLLESQANGN